MLYRRDNSKYYYLKLKHQGRVIRRSTRCTTKREALRVQEQVRRQLCQIRSHTGYTFSDAALRWVKDNQAKRSLNTDIIILQWFAPHLESMFLSEITRDVIEDLRDLRRAQSSKATANRYFQVLRAMLRTARDDWEWIDTIPKIPMYEKRAREPRFLTWEQWLSLEKELPPHLSAPAWFAVSTGLRTAAIQSLRWDWIDRSGVHIPAKIQKNGLALSVPLSGTAWYVLGTQWGQSREYVFVTDTFKPWTGKFVTKAWKKAAQRAGLPDVTFHDLRHCFASWALQGVGVFDKPIPKHIVMELGGWKTEEAFRIYGKYDSGSLERLAGYV